MKKIVLFATCFVIFITASIAQNKILTMEEAVLGQRTTLAPKRLSQLTWIKGSNSFSYIDKVNDKETLFIGTAGSKKVENISIETLNTALKKAKHPEVKAFPSISWESATEFGFEMESKYCIYNLKSKTIIVKDFDLGATASNHEKEPTSGVIAYTIDNNLWIIKEGKKIQITNDQEKNIVNGQSVHRDEFGIHKGTFWSPKGNLLAFYRMDQTMVTDYPIVQFDQRPAATNTIKYPFAGDKSHHVTIGVYDVAKAKTVFLKTGEPEELYLTNIAWSPDEKQIYIAVLNRDQNHLKLNRYNAVNGEFEKTLFEEKHEKYVHPVHALTFLKNNSNQFIWHSERNGFNHLYLYDTNGKLIKQLTKGNWEVTDLVGFDAKGENILYSSTATSPLNRDFYRISIKGGEPKKLTSGEGVHTVFLNETGDYFIDHFSGIDVPRIITINKTTGDKTNELLKAENPLKDYKLGEMKMFSLKSDAGDDLYCRMFHPIDFDSTKKYPVIVYLYNGPGVQLIANSWLGGSDLWYQYMAQRGYVIFTLDGRGSAHRGLAFEQATFRQLGTIEMEDQLKGVEYLKSLPFIDSTRMGVHGWSYGGFMTTSLMTRKPDVFKVGVGGGPVIDWSFYEVMYTERYMDTPQSNKEGYDKSNLLNYVDQLKGKLLLIHGASDDVVVWQHSIMYTKKAVDKGVLFDYFMYPGHPHNVRGKDRVHLMNKITDYFMQYL